MPLSLIVSSLAVATFVAHAADQASTPVVNKKICMKYYDGREVQTRLIGLSWDQCQERCFMAGPCGVFSYGSGPDGSTQCVFNAPWPCNTESKGAEHFKSYITKGQVLPYAPVALSNQCSQYQVGGQNTRKEYVGIGINECHKLCMDTGACNLFSYGKDRDGSSVCMFNAPYECRIGDLMSGHQIYTMKSMTGTVSVTSEWLRFGGNKGKVLDCPAAAGFGTCEDGSDCGHMKGTTAECQRRCEEVDTCTGVAQYYSLACSRTKVRASALSRVSDCWAYDCRNATRPATVKVTKPGVGSSQACYMVKPRGTRSPDAPSSTSGKPPDNDAESTSVSRLTDEPGNDVHAKSTSVVSDAGEKLPEFVSSTPEVRIQESPKDWTAGSVPFAAKGTFGASCCAMFTFVFVLT